MDPISVVGLLASIAGVATAGVAISKALYVAFSSGSIPKDLSDIARGITDLSRILRELSRTLQEGQKLYRRKLLRCIAPSVRRIKKLQGVILKLIEGGGAGVLSRLRWLLSRRTQVESLLYEIESYKTSINTILAIMTLSAAMREPSRSATMARCIPMSTLPWADHQMLTRQWRQIPDECGFRSRQHGLSEHSQYDVSHATGGDFGP